MSTQLKVSQECQDGARLLLTNGVGFWSAAEAIYLRSLDPDQMFHWPVFHVNVCFCFEVTTKGFLAYHGATDKQLRDIGHDLTAGLDSAIAAGYAPPHAAVRDVIDHLSPSHRSHEFRYLRDKSVDLIPTMNLLGTAQRHLQAVGVQIGVADIEITPRR